MIEFDYAKEAEFKAQLDALAKKNRAIMDDLNEHRDEYPFEKRMAIIDEGIKICDEMAKLDTKHKEFLLDQLDKAGVEAVQDIINMMFGVGT